MLCEVALVGRTCLSRCGFWPWVRAVDGRLGTLGDGRDTPLSGRLPGGWSGLAEGPRAGDGDRLLDRCRGRADLGRGEGEGWRTPGAVMRSSMTCREAEVVLAQVSSTSARDSSGLSGTPAGASSSARSGGGPPRLPRRHS